MFLDILKAGLKVAGSIFGGEGGKQIEAVSGMLENKAAQDPAFAAQMQQHELNVLKVYGEDYKDARALVKEALKSEDPYVRRARPTFMYLFYLIIIFNFVVFPIIKAYSPEFTFVFPALPEELYWLFGSAYLGYTGFRSFDKRNKLKNGGESHLTIGKSF